jgi:homoserine O-succinyltransferase
LLAEPEVSEVGLDTRAVSAGTGREITVALVNLMPALAAPAITRQYEQLLMLAAGSARVRLQVFAPGGGGGAETMSALWARSFDALIVTGAEPRAAVMTEEPYWPVLAKLADWAGTHTISVIWSCLAAHAAVFHLDGLMRRRLGAKLSGLFACEAADGQEIFGAASRHYVVPHSRYNTLDEAALTACGYTILARGPRVGADRFVKQHHDSLFVFLQGHPEYAADTLLREYSRDVGRFLAGGQGHPRMPEGYFDAETEAALVALRERMMREPKAARVAEIGECLVRRPIDGWRDAAAGFYADWLSYVAARQPVGVVP